MLASGTAAAASGGGACFGALAGLDGYGRGGRIRAFAAFARLTLVLAFPAPAFAVLPTWLIDISTYGEVAVVSAGGAFVWSVIFQSF